MAANTDFHAVQLTGKSTVNGKGTRALDHDGQGNGDGEKMVFNAFALLISEPVCEQTKMPVHREYGYQHVAADTEGRYAAEKAEEQADAPQKFRADGQESEGSRNMHALSEETHGAGETIAAKPAESLLRAVSKESDTENQAKNGDGRIASGIDELTKHQMALLTVGQKWHSGKRRCYTDFDL